MLIVSAMREIGVGNITDAQFDIIKEHFSKITKEEFKTDARLDS
jgi:hypothetical protein